MATEIRTETFDSFVAQDKPVLVDFWATWCGPCRMLAPVVDEVSAAHSELQVGKVDVDACPELAEKFGIMMIPTLLLFKNGQLVNKTSGYKDRSELESLVSEVL